MALDFTAGCFGGCAGLVVGYPLDTIKVHLQTQDTKNPRFRGTWHCFRTLLAAESVTTNSVNATQITGLYRGMTSPLAGIALVNALTFGIYGEAQRQFSNPEQLSSHFVAGAAAGLAQSPVVCPLELAKTQMQLQSGSGRGSYSGPVECLKDIYKRSGLSGIFRGLGVTVLRETPSFGIYFSTYEAFTRTGANEQVSTLTMLLAGGLAGSLSWLFTYPIDVIKSRVQADVDGKYLGAIDCLKKSVKTDGFSCLFRGLNSTLIRAFPTNAATFAIVHWTFRIFGGEGKGLEELKQIAAVKDNCVGEKWNSFVQLWSGDAYANSFFLAIARGDRAATGGEDGGGGKGCIVESDTN